MADSPLTKRMRLMPGTSLAVIGAPPASAACLNPCPKASA